MNTMFNEKKPTNHNTRDFQGIYEYLLVLLPNKVISDDVTEMKFEFYSIDPSAISKGSKPHITLICFIFNSKYEFRLINYLTIFSKSIIPFKVEIDGFGAFTNAIYLNVISKEPIVNIVKELKVRYQNILKPNWTRFYLTPHLTIARRLTEKQKEKTWETWRNKKYKSSFRVNEMILLRRKLGGGKCEVIKKFRFTGKCPMPVQGMLF